MRLVRSLPIAIAVAIVVLTSGVSCKSGPPPTPVLTNTETWCPDGFESGPQDTCFAIPDSHDAKTPVLVYLHGMYEGHGSAAEWTAVREASKHGFAVIIPRGHRGACAWKAELKDHFCWPTEADDPQAFKSIVAEWDRVLWQVDTLLEGGPHKRYVLGNSNGGLFASYLATQGTFPAQAYAVVNGGLLAPPPKVSRPPPMLLLTSSAGDEATRMKELHDTLAKASWTHAWCTRPSPEAALQAADVDAALRFFKRDAEGSLKPQASSYACEAGLKAGP